MPPCYYASGISSQNVPILTSHKKKKDEYIYLAKNGQVIHTWNSITQDSFCCLVILSLRMACIWWATHTHVKAIILEENQNKISISCSGSWFCKVTIKIKIRGLDLFLKLPSIVIQSQMQTLFSFLCHSLSRHNYHHRLGISSPCLPLRMPVFLLLMTPLAEKKSTKLLTLVSGTLKDIWLKQKSQKAFETGTGTQHSARLQGLKGLVLWLLSSYCTCSTFGAKNKMQITGQKCCCRCIIVIVQAEEGCRDNRHYY